MNVNAAKLTPLQITQIRKKYRFLLDRIYYIFQYLTNEFILNTKEVLFFMEEFCIIAFDSTHQAIACEKLLKDFGFHIRIIPVPREITANCGLAIRFEYEDYEKICAAVCQFDTLTFYKVLKQGLKKKITPIH